MKKIKVLCFTILATFLCVLNVDARQVDTAENSSNGSIAITHSLTGELKYQWVHVEYENYSPKVNELKAIVEEINNLAADYNTQAAKLKTAIAAYNKAYEDYAAKKISRDQLREYNDAVEAEEKVLNQKKAAYDAKEDEFNNEVKQLAPIDENKWQTVSGKEIAFDNAEYTQGDAAVLWINTGDSTRPNESSIYMYDEQDGALKKEVNCPILNNYCAVVNGVYYGPEGTEVTKEVYENACLPKVCKVENGKYYGVDGKEVSEAEYKAECETAPVTPKNPACKIENGKYYGPEGQEITKEKYAELCPKNPKTGNTLPVALGALALLIGGAGIVIASKKKLFKQI